MSPRWDGELSGQHFAVATGGLMLPGGAGSGPPPSMRPGAPGPYSVVVLLEVVTAVAPEPRLRIQQHPDPGPPSGRGDAAQQHHAVGVAGERQGFPAFDRAVGGDPPAAPDEAARFVVAAPHMPLVGGGDRVHAATPDQGREHRVAVPAGRAHPGDVTVRADQRASFPVGEQRVLAQHLRPESRASVDGVVCCHLCHPFCVRSVPG